MVSFLHQNKRYLVIVYLKIMNIWHHKNHICDRLTKTTANLRYAFILGVCLAKLSSSSHFVIFRVRCAFCAFCLLWGKCKGDRQWDHMHFKITKNWFLN